jgi:hypothetical protein
MGPFATEKRNAAISQNWISRRDGGSNENGEPRARFSPGVPELSLILGSRQAVPRGVGGGMPYSQPTNGSNISVGGWGACLTPRR